MLFIMFILHLGVLLVTFSYSNVTFFYLLCCFLVSFKLSDPETGKED